jgi:imidazolonepropionase-like amidohydrolase
MHAERADIVITHVAVIDVLNGKVDQDQTITISARRISSIEPANRAHIPTSARVIDGRGKFAVPGLWDMHVHLDSPAIAALVSRGITGVRDMGNSPRELLAIRRAITSGKLIGPRIIMAGPMFVGPPTAPQPYRVVASTDSEAAHAVDSLVNVGVDFIKVHDGVSRSVYFALAREARLRRIPYAGHVPSVVSPQEASDSGQRSIEHLEFLPDECLALFAEVKSAAVPNSCSPANIDSLLRHLARNRTWIDPTISMFRAYVKPVAYDSIFAGFKRLAPSLNRSGIRILVGTDTENSRIAAGQSLFDEMELLVAAGISPFDVLRGATSSATEFLGVSDSLGTIGRGKLADIILLDANPVDAISNLRSISKVILNGVLVSPDSAMLRTR